jgi:hypothetical protein
VTAGTYPAGVPNFLDPIEGRALRLLALLLLGLVSTGQIRSERRAIPPTPAGGRDGPSLRRHGKGQSIRPARGR